MDPTRVGSEETEGLAGPKSVALAPNGDIGHILLGILIEGFHVILPHDLLRADVLLEDAGPLCVVDTNLDCLTSLTVIHFVHV